MSQRCWLDAAICMQNFLLQNGTFRVLVVLVFCLVIPSFFTMAGAADYTPLRYDTSSLCSAALAISSSNYAECKGTISLYSHLSQAELGHIIYVSGGTISNYEKGVHYPDVEKLVRLADYFNVSMNWCGAGRSLMPKASIC